VPDTGSPDGLRAGAHTVILTFVGAGSIASGPVKNPVHLSEPNGSPGRNIW